MLTYYSSCSLLKVPSIHEEFLSASHVARRNQVTFTDNAWSEICEFVKYNWQELMGEISRVKVKIYKHGPLLPEKSKILSKIVTTIRNAMTTLCELCEANKRDMFRLQLIEKQKDTTHLAATFWWLMRPARVQWHLKKLGIRRFGRVCFFKAKNLAVTTTPITQGDLLGQSYLNIWRSY